MFPVCRSSPRSPPVSPWFPAHAIYLLPVAFIGELSTCFLPSCQQQAQIEFLSLQGFFPVLPPPPPFTQSNSFRHPSTQAYRTRPTRLTVPNNEAPQGQRNSPPILLSPTCDPGQLLTGEIRDNSQGYSRKRAAKKPIPTTIANRSSRYPWATQHWPSTFPIALGAFGLPLIAQASRDRPPRRLLVASTLQLTLHVWPKQAPPTIPRSEDSSPLFLAYGGLGKKKAKPLSPTYPLAATASSLVFLRRPSCESPQESPQAVSL